jgi:hypothetical protein
LPATLLLFCPFSPNIYYIYNRNCIKEVFYEEKERKKWRMPTTDGSIKLSKAALWTLKHPGGMEGAILDIRAVMK